MADTVDYTEVIDVVTEVATVQSYSLLERLAGPPPRPSCGSSPSDEVWVQVTKPHPPVACALDSVAAAVELQRADLEG